MYDVSLLLDENSIFEAVLVHNTLVSHATAVIMEFSSSSLQKNSRRKNQLMQQNKKRY